MIKRYLTRENIFTALGIIPLMVFLRVAGWYGFTDEAWMRAFVSGAALSVIVLALSAWLKVPARDAVIAASMMLISGGIAFLAGLEPVVNFYGRRQGSVFIAWYLAVRAGLALAPKLSSGLVHDPYADRPGLASGLALLALAWSLFHRNLLVSVVLPFALLTISLSLACRPGTGKTTAISPGGRLAASLNRLAGKFLKI